MTRLVRAVRALSPEERANTLTHGAGILLSLAGVAALALQVRAPQEPRHALAIAVYGVCLISLFAASTLCHLATATTSPRLRRLTLTLDYVCIYLVIAGTYTPFLLTAVGGSLGTALLIAVWAMGGAGMLWEILGGRRSELVACAAYLAMGWLAVLVTEPLLAALGRDGVGLLVAGGLCYSAGVVFFLLRRMPYGHAVWHLFVLAGSALHYAGVLRLSPSPLAPRPSPLASAALGSWTPPRLRHVAPGADCTPEWAVLGEEAATGDFAAVRRRSRPSGQDGALRGAAQPRRREGPGDGRAPPG